MAENNLNITALQLNPVWNDAQHNRSEAEAMIRHSEKTDLFILPEMFTTGFIPHPEDSCEAEDGDTLAWMKRMATMTDAAITGSVAIKTKQGDYRNRMYFVKPDGTSTFYDKHHLFTYAGEDQHYTPGKAPVIVSWRGVRIMLQVCYDLRFPCFSRNNSQTYDLLIYVASWPESRRHVWDILLRARAIENQCYVAGVNRIGDDPSCHYNGGTTIISPYGKAVATAADDTAGSITAPLDLNRLRAFREKFPVLRDAD